MWMDRQRARLCTRRDSYRAIADGQIPDGMLPAQVTHKLTYSLPATLQALERIEQGTYGVCVDCQSEIPRARLQSIPAASRCMDCEKERETRS